jgi:carbon-monoxide dehydrogenase large subunit
LFGEAAASSNSGAASPGEVVAVGASDAFDPPLNPLGVKGVGEGGAVAPPAAIANAVCDALAPFGVEVNATPIKPEQLVRATRPR